MVPPSANSRPMPRAVRLASIAASSTFRPVLITSTPGKPSSRAASSAATRAGLSTVRVPSRRARTIPALSIRRRAAFNVRQAPLRDRVSGRAEHDPFGALRAGIMVCVEDGGQWHVQQHCHSYPAGVWQQLRGGRRGDEPVDQDGGTVGDGGNDAGQVGAGARAGYRPRRGDGRDQHIPSGLGHSGADAPVVDVAAGRLAGIVEPLGNYYMHPLDIPALQSACPRRASLHPAAELNLTRRRSVIPGTGWYVAAVDAVRPETIGVPRHQRGAASSSAGPGGTGSAGPDTVRDLM